MKAAMSEATPAATPAALLMAPSVAAAEMAVGLVTSCRSPEPALLLDPPPGMAMGMGGAPATGRAIGRMGGPLLRLDRWCALEEPPWWRHPRLAAAAAAAALAATAAAVFAVRGVMFSPESRSAPLSPLLAEAPGGPVLMLGPEEEEEEPGPDLPTALLVGALMDLCRSKPAAPAPLPPAPDPPPLPAPPSDAPALLWPCRPRPPGAELLLACPANAELPMTFEMA